MKVSETTHRINNIDNVGNIGLWSMYYIILYPFTSTIHEIAKIVCHVISCSLSWSFSWCLEERIDSWPVDLRWAPTSSWFGRETDASCRRQPSCDGSWRSTCDTNGRLKTTGWPWLEAAVGFPGLPPLGFIDHRFGFESYTVYMTIYYIKIITVNSMYQ